MAARDIVHAAIFLGRIIEPDPAGEVRHWLGPCPIGKILMPRYYAAVLGWFAEELIMKEPEAFSQ